MFVKTLKLLVPNIQNHQNGKFYSCHIKLVNSKIVLLKFSISILNLSQMYSHLDIFFYK